MISSAVFTTFRDWLFFADQASTLANSTGMEAELDAGITIVTSSAYLTNRFARRDSLEIGSAYDKHYRSQSGALNYVEIYNLVFYILQF